MYSDALASAVGERMHNEIAYQRLSELTARFGELDPVLFSQLRAAMDDYDFVTSDRVFAELKTRLHIQFELQELTAILGGPRPATESIFVVGAGLLYEAYQSLGKRKTEAILYATGNRFADLVTIERLAPVKLEKSEYGYASTDFADTTRFLCELDKTGTLLTAYFHMHPGRGDGSNHPSGTDLANQERMERGGFTTVGGIFSRDGHLRFFTDQLKFAIRITGKGVEHVGTNHFRLIDS